MEVSGNYAYIVDSQTGNLDVINISNPNNPVMIANLSAGASVVDVAIAGNYAYAIGAGKLKRINISSPSNLVLVDSIAVGPSPIVVDASGTTAFALDYNDSYLRAIDLNRPSIVTFNPQDGTLSYGSGDNMGEHTAEKNIQLGNYWLSGDGGDKGIRVNNNGNVGIGTNSIVNNLDVEGGVAIGSAYSGTNTAPSNGAIIEGNVGIGTTNPTNGKLEVSGTANIINPGTFGYLNNDSSTGPTDIVSGYNYAYSIYANDRIAASEFNALSDARIKKIIGPSNSEADLATLIAIEITDYQYIDTIQRGTELEKKVIAQQLKKIYPQAVSKLNREVIPDIYQRATLNQGWIELTTDLRVGERVKIITENSNDLHPVTAVEAGRFQVADLAAEGNGTVFVYGREVDDFHT
ncbi:MAG: tail fiber domain-containing protein, partial [Bacteroidota bacterium]